MDPSPDTAVEIDVQLSAAVTPETLIIIWHEVGLTEILLRRTYVAY